MNFKKTITLAAFALTLQLSAQTNVFQKTTWKIESISADGKAVLKKAKKINLPSEQSKFHFLQFDNEKFDTGNSCFHMDGRYSVFEPNTVEFSAGAADMAGDCKEPKSLTGSYTYVLKKDTLELTPAEKIDYDEPMPEAAVMEEDASVETAGKAAADVQNSSKKPAEKSPKKTKR
ncbi:hypothetical protein [Chryseobacterium sp. Leaf394]|uniref:hypothetical protein n=1 Tax=Chryseobacterium sp. Leaf394 TaxID=1736361 RepID=UPI0006FD9EEF|nr:hypothetical protein [Chryseobacterium sp. Leaf394]KQS92479.1 hypothetical protein ASG21_08565 [Chryseobacterium sp. Leaf394]